MKNQGNYICLNGFPFSHGNDTLWAGPMEEFTTSPYKCLAQLPHHFMFRIYIALEDDTDIDDISKIG